MLYLHVPFCVRKCLYCDFLSGAYDQAVRKAYLEALSQEIEIRWRECSGRPVTSIFLGGGTPSLLEPEELAQLMGKLRESFAIAEDAEITMECNPGTAGYGKFVGYKQAGINRLSMGLQSANNEELRLLGRIHTFEDFLSTYEGARKAGFTNVSLDLMSALPGQTFLSWQETLEKVLALQPLPEHLSVYSLILEEGTRFYDMERQGLFRDGLAIPSEELDRDMYHYTSERLRRAGFEQYEISNYARPGYVCRHNFGYWTRKEYLGLGLGAASLLGEVRYANETNLERYLRDPAAGRTEERLTRQEQMEEFAFLGLRTTQGVLRTDFETAFGEKLDDLYASVIRKNVSDGLLEDGGERIRLTERGMDLSNYVMAQFLLS